MDQNNDREKGHEVKKMREYYSNSTVTLVSIQANIGEEIVKKLLKSFEDRNKGENKRIYPNKVIENSLPILEKIISSE
jgi:hypothetical protein